MNFTPVHLLGFAVLLVPLLPFHYEPQFNFRTEWPFAILCSLAWFLTKENIRLSALRQMPTLWLLGVVGIASLSSSAFGKGYGSQPFMVPLYCAFAAGVYVLVRGAYQQEGNSSALAPSLAVATLFSGLLASVPAAFQLNKFDPGLYLVASRGDHPAVVGNIGQANQFGDWLWLAITAAAYLGASGRIGVKVVMFAMAPLALFAVTTGSRSVWLYPLVAMLGIWVVGRADDGTRKPFLRLILFALLMQVLIHQIFVSFRGYEAFGLSSSVDRLRQGGDELDGNVRTAIWLRTLEVIKDAPWWGTGSGSFRHVSLEKLLENGGGVVPVGEHAHNLFLQFAVEYGVPITVAMMFGLCFWLAQCFSGKLSGAGLWSFASLCVIGIHSMLEYPLWLVYFLGIAAIHLAIADGSLGAGSGQIVVRLWCQRVFGVLSVGVLVVIGLQYQHIEWARKTMRFQMTSGIGTKAGLPQLPDASLEFIDSLPRWSPWRSDAEAITILGAFPESADAQLWLPRCRRVMKSDDSSLILARCSMVMALSGDDVEASRIAELGCLDYPRKSDRFPELMVRLGRLMNVASMPRASCLQEGAAMAVTIGPMWPHGEYGGAAGGSADK